MPALAAALLVILCLAACGGSSANRYTYEGVSLEMPEDFTVDDSGSTVIAYGPDYPDKTDNITFVYAAADSADNYSQEIFEAYYAAMFGAIDSHSFDKTKISGKDAIKYSYAISMNGVDMEQTQVMVFLSDKTVFITFTSVTGDYDSAFAKSIDSISAK